MSQKYAIEEKYIESLIVEILDYYYITFNSIECYSAEREICFGPNENFKCTEYVFLIDNRKIVSYINFNDLIKEVIKFCIYKTKGHITRNDAFEILFCHQVAAHISTHLDSYDIKYNYLICYMVARNTVICFLDNHRLISVNKEYLNNDIDLLKQVRKLYRKEIKNYQEAHDCRDYQWYVEYFIENTGLEEVNIKRFNYQWDDTHEEKLKHLEEANFEYFTNEKRKRNLEIILSEPNG